MRTIPLMDWIRGIKQQEELEGAQREADLQRNNAALETIRNERSQFWIAFIERFRTRASKCSGDDSCSVPRLEEIGIRGQVSNQPDLSVRVLITVRSVGGSQTYTDLRCSETGILCFAPQGEPFLLSFWARPESGIRVTANDHLAPMTAQEAADFILQGMVLFVKPLLKRFINPKTFS